MFWIKNSGLKALRVAEEDLSDWPLALNLCNRLAELYPQQRAAMEAKAIKLKEQLPDSRK